MSSLDGPISTLAELSKECLAVLGAIGAKAERPSPRSEEIGFAKAGAGGKARSKLIDELSNSSKSLAIHAVCLVEAVSDQFSVAAARDNAFNLPALTIIVRALAETAGTSAWLLEPGISPTVRGRRYLTWRFNELKSDHLLLRDDLEQLKTEGERSALAQAALKDLETRESALLGAATSAKWTAQPRVKAANGKVSPAALIATNGKVEPMPSSTQLVNQLGPGSDLYSLLSRPAHASLSNIEIGFRPGREPKRNQPGWLEYHGQGIGPDIALQLVAVSVMQSIGRLADWNAVSTQRLRAVLAQVLSPECAG
jgi:hypothetical protein